MTTLAGLLRDKKASIADRWTEEIFAAYPRNVSDFLRREKDRFANPAGYALRTGTCAILYGILDGMNEDDIRRSLEDIIRIRAVQDFTPSGAVSFVFLLKKAVRSELGKAIDDPGVAAELVGFEDNVDRVALIAFDIFARCREQISELKVNEIKRSVSGIMRRLNKCGADEEPAPEESGE